MIILIRKRLIWGSALFLCFFVCFFVCFAAVLWAGHGMDIPVFAAREEVPVTVVIDPGHGGEDGGAVSTDGVEESQINLAISRQVNDLLRFAGQRTVMTRTEDVSICDEGLSTVRQRKASDIRNRVSIVNSRENAVLVSIHQNSLPSSTVTSAVMGPPKPSASPLSASAAQADAIMASIASASTRDRNFFME